MNFSAMTTLRSLKITNRRVDNDLPLTLEHNALECWDMTPTVPWLDFLPYPNLAHLDLHDSVAFRPMPRPSGSGDAILTPTAAPPRPWTCSTVSTGAWQIGRRPST